MPTTNVTATAYTVGTASSVVVGMSADAQVAVIQNLEPKNTSDAYAKEGTFTSYNVSSQYRRLARQFLNWLLALPAFKLTTTKFCLTQTR